jgi:hypothetical protein
VIKKFEPSQCFPELPGEDCKAFPQGTVENGAVGPPGVEAEAQPDPGPTAQLWLRPWVNSCSTNPARPLPASGASCGRCPWSGASGSTLRVCNLDIVAEFALVDLSERFLERIMTDIGNLPARRGITNGWVAILGRIRSNCTRPAIDLHRINRLRSERRIGRKAT